MEWELLDVHYLEVSVIMLSIIRIYYDLKLLASKAIRFIQHLYFNSFVRRLVVFLVGVAIYSCFIEFFSKVFGIKASIFRLCFIDVSQGSYVDTHNNEIKKAQWGE